MLEELLKALLAATKASIAGDNGENDGDSTDPTTILHSCLSRLSSLYGCSSSSFGALVDAVDSSLAAADISMDQARAQTNNTSSAAPSSAPSTSSSSFPSFNPNSRPQLLFDPPVDNSPRVWLPIIKNKPYALPDHPLIDYNADYLSFLARPSRGSPELSSAMQSHLAALNGPNASRRANNDKPVYEPEHPYKYEISELGYPDWQLTAQPLRKFPPMDRTPLVWVSDDSALQQLAEALESVEEFTVDLEHHNYRSYLGFTCLIQISTRTTDYLVDALRLRSRLHTLAPAFANPAIVKVFHGADMDMLWLQRDFGIYVVNLFDTGQAARVLELPSFSLAYALQFYCDVKTDKKYQLADWRQRPLSPEMELYARMDTHFLFYIKDRMVSQLIDKSKAQTMSVANAAGESVSVPLMYGETLARSRAVSLKVFSFDSLSPNAAHAMAHRYNLSFNDVQLSVLHSVLQQRDCIARDEDESTGYVCSNQILFNLAEQMPSDTRGLFVACKPNTPILIRKYSQSWLKAIASGKNNAYKPSPYLSARSDSNTATASVDAGAASDDEPLDMPGPADKRRSLANANGKSKANDKAAEASASLFKADRFNDAAGDSLMDGNPDSDAAVGGIGIFQTFHWPHAAVAAGSRAVATERFELKEAPVERQIKAVKSKAQKKSAGASLFFPPVPSFSPSPSLLSASQRLYGAMREREEFLAALVENEMAEAKEKEEKKKASDAAAASVAAASSAAAVHESLAPYGPVSTIRPHKRPAAVAHDDDEEGLVKEPKFADVNAYDYKKPMTAPSPSLLAASSNYFNPVSEADRLDESLHKRVAKPKTKVKQRSFTAKTRK